MHIDNLYATRQATGRTVSSLAWSWGVKHALRVALHCGVVILCMLGSGCGDEIFLNPPAANSPPQILLFGPELDSVNPIAGPLPTFWVIPGDPDGVSDIAAVVLNIRTINLNSLIVRPDSAEAPCVWTRYVPMDTIDVMPYLLTRSFRVNNLRLRNDGGVYGYSLGYLALTEGGISAHASVFGPRIKGCYSGVDYQYYLERVGLYPPAVPAPRDVHITYADLSVAEITITVYDQSGATAVATYPNVRVVFSNFKEDHTLP